MKIYHNLEQGSTEWFEMRHGKIGGTRAKQLSVKSDTLLIELLAELTEPYDEDLESYKSDAMENGSNLEPQARIELEKYTGFKFLEVGWIQSENQLIGVSPDGITECETIGCEIKCPEAKEHFMSYRPESIKTMFIKLLTRESLVNIGTEARPVVKTIKEVIELHTVAVKELEIKIEQSINQLKF